MSARVIGTVVRFFDQPDRLYGFIAPKGGGKEVHFHLDGGEDKPVTYAPQPGDEVSYLLELGRKGPAANSWRVTKKAAVLPKRVILTFANLQGLGRDQFRPGDMIVATSDAGGGSNYVAWYSVIYRPATGQVFKIYCSDGEDRGYQPDGIPDGKLPEHIKIIGLQRRSNW
jgi:cold shock CspA family protein